MRLSSPVEEVAGRRRFGRSKSHKEGRIPPTVTTIPPCGERISETSERQTSRASPSADPQPHTQACGYQIQSMIFSFIRQRERDEREKRAPTRMTCGETRANWHTASRPSLGQVNRYPGMRETPENGCMRMFNGLSHDHFPNLSPYPANHPSGRMLLFLLVCSSNPLLELFKGRIDYNSYRRELQGKQCGGTTCGYGENCCYGNICCGGHAATTPITQAANAGSASLP